MLDRIKPYFQRPDIPFSREDANRYLPWVMAVMVCLVGLLMTVGISLQQSSNRSGELDLKRFQVYVPYEKADEALVQSVAALLEEESTVEQAEKLPVRALEEWISPWTDGSLPLEELPLPVVFEVTLETEVDRETALEALGEKLQTLDPDIALESYQEWVESLAQFTGTLRTGVFFLVALMLTAMLALVMVVVRTSLMLNFQTVRLLHHVGATDEYILKQFVTNGALLVLKGSAMGMGMASMIAVTVSYVSMASASPLLPALELSGLHLLMLIVLPLMVVMLAAVIMRVTIAQMLEQMH